MSFKCEACDRRFAGIPNYDVCTECRSTQMGRAVLLVYSLREEGVDSSTLSQLEEILGEAQNVPPEGKSDGSISEARWNRFRDLTVSARAYDADLERALRFP